MLSWPRSGLLQHGLVPLHPPTERASCLGLAECPSTVTTGSGRARSHLLLLGPALRLESTQDGTQRRHSGLRVPGPCRRLHVLPAGTNPQEEVSHLTAEGRAAAWRQAACRGCGRGSRGSGARCSGLLIPARSKQCECPLSQEGKRDHGPAPHGGNSSPVHVHPHLWSASTSEHAVTSSSVGEV